MERGWEGTWEGKNVYLGTKKTKERGRERERKKKEGR
jgi:hypothetical protein